MRHSFHYADETFTVLRRISRGKWAGYLLCRTWLGLCYFREDWRKREEGKRCPN